MRCKTWFRWAVTHPGPKVHLRSRILCQGCGFGGRLPNNGQESGFGSKTSKKKSTTVAFYSVLSCFLGSAPSGTRTQDPLIKRCIIFSYSTSFHSDITIFLSRTRYISFFLFLSFLSFYGINGQITVRIRGVFSLFLSAVFKNSCRNASTTPILWYALRLNDIA